MRYSALQRKDNFASIGRILGELIPLLNRIEPQENDLQTLICISISAALTVHAPHLSGEHIGKLANQFAEAFCRSYELQNWIMERQN